MSNRRGFSLIELTVAMAIVALLLAIILPAVQVVRGSSRRMQCASNLHQLGIACANYESLYGCFPNAGAHKYVLLPFLEEVALYESRLPNDPQDWDAAWRPIADRAPAVYRCPADSEPSVIMDGGKRMSTVNYLGCQGNNDFSRESQKSGMFVYSDRDPRTGQPYLRYIRLAEVLRGTSNVALMSEMLHGTDQPIQSLDRLRVIWQLPGGFTRAQFADFAALCESVPPDAAARGWLGSSSLGIPWFMGGEGHETYYHSLTPNFPSCHSPYVGTRGGIYTAASNHGGGVNVLYVDGHVSFVSENVDRSVWRATGARH